MKKVEGRLKKAGKIIEKMRQVEDKILLTSRPFKVHSTTLGQRAADWLTEWAGSWTFIISVAIFLFIWMSINTTWIIFGSKWDPYPFILLNFILSTLAAMPGKLKPCRGLTTRETTGSDSLKDIHWSFYRTTVVRILFF